MCHRNPMAKDFDRWNIQKKIVDGDWRNRPYKEGDIWWCSLGVNIGFEHDGVGDTYQRPVLILKGFSSTTCLAVPLTSSLKKHPMRIPLGMVEDKQASGILSQMRVIDTKRLLGKMESLDSITFNSIRKVVRNMF